MADLIRRLHFLGSGPATVASAQAVANELMHEKQTRESQFILIGQSLSAARWLAERDGRRQPRARRSCSVRCARAASRGPQIDSDDDNNPEIIFAESDQSYIKKSSPRSCCDVTTTWRARSASSLTSGMAPCAMRTVNRSHSMGRALKRAWLRQARCTGRVRARSELAQAPQLGREGSALEGHAPAVKPGPLAGPGRDPHALPP